MIDKTAALERVNGAVLELGCGASKAAPDAIGTDLLDFDGVDLVGDVYDVLDQIPDRSLSEVHSEHFFEHVPDLDRLMAETARVLQPGGTMSVKVPHWSNPYFYSDPTHRRFFGLYSFSYLARCELFRRRVPEYGQEKRFAVVGVDLVFRQEAPTKWGRWIHGAAHKRVNSSPSAQEFYEANLARLVPCYELVFILRRD